MQLSPTETFILTRQLDDPADTNTYYVRCIIRNAKTDATIATVNLTNKGNGRFRGEWQVTADISGQGYYITITSYVYTDASYTTESNNCRRFEQQYLVQDRFARMGGGGGGVKVNYDKIRVMIAEEVANINLPEKIDLSPIFIAISGVKKAIDNKKMPELPKIEFPAQKDIDFNPLLKGMSELNEKISLLKNADLEPIISYLHDLQKIIETKSEIEEIKKVLSEMPAEFYALFSKKELEKLPKPAPKRKEFISGIKPNNNPKKQFIFG